MGHLVSIYVVYKNSTLFTKEWKITNEGVVVVEARVVEHTSWEFQFHISAELYNIYILYYTYKEKTRNS